MTSKKKVKKAFVVVIRKPLVILTGNFKLALVLGQMLYWLERRHDVDDYILEERERNPDTTIDLTDGWIYKSGKELAEELMTGWSAQTVRRFLSTLVDMGYLDRRNNPKYKWDKCFQYRPDLYKIQRDLLAQNLVLDGYPILEGVMTDVRFSILKETSPMVDDGKTIEDNRGCAAGTALPEISPEVSPEVTTTTAKPKQETPKVVVPDPIPSVPPLSGKDSDPYSYTPTDCPDCGGSGYTFDQASRAGELCTCGGAVPPTDDEEITIGFRIVRTNDEPRVYTLTPHPRAYRLICPECEAQCDWPQSHGKRRKHPLVCSGCGACFKVVTESPSGTPHTYEKRQAKVATSFWVQVDDAPKGFKAFKAGEADARLLHSTWKATNGEAVLKGLRWMAGKKTAKQWGNVAVSLLVTIQRNGKRENSWGVAPPPSRPPPRAEVDWNKVMEEAAETNEDLFAEEEEGE